MLSWEYELHFLVIIELSDMPIRKLDLIVDKRVCDLDERMNWITYSDYRFCSRCESGLFTQDILTISPQAGRSLNVIGAEPRAGRRQAGWPRHRIRWDRDGTAGAAETPSLAPR